LARFCQLAGRRVPSRPTEQPSPSLAMPVDEIDVDAHSPLTAVGGDTPWKSSTNAKKFEPAPAPREAPNKAAGWRTCAIVAMVLLIISTLGNLAMNTVAFVLMREMHIETQGNYPIMVSNTGRPVGVHAVHDVYNSATAVEAGNVTIGHVHGQLQQQAASVACSEVLAGVRNLEGGLDNQFTVKCRAPGCDSEVSVMSVSSSRFAPAGSDQSLDEQAGWFAVLGMAVSNDPEPLLYDSECHMSVAHCQANPTSLCAVQAYATTPEAQRRHLKESHGAADADLDQLFAAIHDPTELRAAVHQFNADHRDEARRRQLYHSAYCPAITGAGCHPAGSLLHVEGGKRLPIEKAAVGMRVATPSGYQPITGVFHAETDATDKFVQLSTADGHVMAITPLHLVFANGVEVDPGTVRVGDLLSTLHGTSAVTRVESVQLDGKFHIFVDGGAYYVDGVLASDTLDLVPRPLWPVVRAYVKARYQLGVPIMPVGTGVFPNHAWLLDLLTRIGTPQPLLKFGLFPLTVTAGIGTELVNSAVEYFRVTLGTAATMAAVAGTMGKVAPLRARASA